MSDRTLDIALRIKAEMDQARTQIDQFNQSLGNTGKAAASSTTGTKAQAAALNDLLAKIDPTIKKLGELDVAEAKLRQAKLSGLIDDEGFARFSAAITKQRGELDGAGKAIHSFSLNNSMARLELGRLSKDIATGQYSRFGQSAMTLANYSGVMGAAFSATGLAVLGTTAVVGLLTAALVSGYLESQHYNSALIATGNYAGVTSTQLRALAGTIGAQSHDYGDADRAVLLLAQSGRVAGDALGDAARAAVAMAALTGQSIDQAVAAVVKLQGDPVHAIRALDDQFHFLTASVYEQILALQNQGRETEAAALAQKTMADALEERERRDVASLGSIQRAWRDLSGAMSEGLALIKGIGSADLSQQLDQLYLKRGAAQSMAEGTLTGGLPGMQAYAARRIADIDKQIAALKDLQEQQEKTAKDDSADRQNQSAGIAAVDRLDALAKGYDKVADKQAIVKKLNADLALQWKTTSTLPAGVDMTGADINGPGAFDGKGYDFLLKKALGESVALKKPKSDAAAQRAAAAAQAELIKALADEQGALDPTVKIWATYNDQVTKANALADKAKTAKGADVAAINGERDALITVYAAARDNDLGKLAEKDRQAWEKLRDSLRTPVEVKIDNAIAQIAQLNEFLKKGTITSDQYHDSLKRVGEKSVGALPSVHGIDASVGGPTSELRKNFGEQSDLDAKYAEETAANERFRASDTASYEVYLAAKAKLDAEYAQKSAVLEQSRQQLVLTTASDLFGQLAQLSHSHNTKMAAIGKAAAIAQAVINTYQSATAAYAAMASIPYVGPFLGAAAAAAAIAAGLANVQAIRSQPTSFAVGGYTGPGGKFEEAGVVHRGEGVLSQEDIASLGGPSGFYALRAAIQDGDLHMAGYADGGYVSPLSGAPQLPASSTPRARLPATAANDSAGPAVHNNFRFLTAFDANDLAEKILATPAAERLVVNHVIANGSAVKQRIG